MNMKEGKFNDPATWAIEQMDTAEKQTEEPASPEAQEPANPEKYRVAPEVSEEQVAAQNVEQEVTLQETDTERVARLRSELNETFGSKSVEEPVVEQQRENITLENSEVISAEKAEKMISEFEVNAAKQSQEAFDYVRLKDNEYGADLTKNLSIDNPYSFEDALSYKAMSNKESRKKIILGSVVSGGVGIIGTVATVAAQAGGALSTAAVVGGLSASGLMFLVVPAALAVGGTFWAGKKVYDTLKERGAKKNFEKARTAKESSRSLFSRLMGKK